MDFALSKKTCCWKYASSMVFMALFLYVGATIFVLFMAMENPRSQIWKGLFWIIQLFICINAVAKSFLQESRGRMLYYHSIASRKNFVLAKLFLIHCLCW